MSNNCGPVDIERDGNPQARRSFRNRWRADRADIETFRPHALRNAHRATIVADHHRQDLRSAAFDAKRGSQLRIGEGSQPSKSARRCGSSTRIFRASRTPAAISGDGAVE